jgi:hypothetical protein
MFLYFFIASLYLGTRPEETKQFASVMWACGAGTMFLGILTWGSFSLWWENWTQGERTLDLSKKEES